MRVWKRLREKRLEGEVDQSYSWANGEGGGGGELCKKGDHMKNREKERFLYWEVGGYKGCL